MKTLKYVLLTAALFIFLACDKYEHKIVQEQATIVAKAYKPELNLHTQGYGYNTSGELELMTGSSHQNEEFNVVILTFTGKKETIDDIEIYAKANVGDTVTISFKQTIIQSKNPKRNGKIRYETLESVTLTKEW